jgi:hypothetical protein
MMKTSSRFLKQSGLTLVIVALIIMCSADRRFSQQSDVSSQVDIKVLSAVVTKFEKPIRIGPPKRAIEYREALVLQVEVDRDRFDSLPPDMEPFLYIGRNEYHIFAVDRQDSRKTLLLTFHIRNWTQLRDNSPMVLTIDHDAPLRNPERFERQQGPRFKKAIIAGSPG